MAASPFHRSASLRNPSTLELPVALPSQSRNPSKRSPSIKKTFQIEPKAEKTLRKELSTKAKDVRDGDVLKTFEMFHPEQYHLEDGEEKTYMEPISKQDPEAKDLLNTVMDWINQEMGAEATRIKIDNPEMAFFDGLVLKALIERLSGETISMPAGEFVQSEERIKCNLSHILNRVDAIIGIEESQRKWSAESIFAKDLLSTFHLILAMITHFTDQGRIQLDLPKNASVKVIRVRKKGMTLETESFKEKVISPKFHDGFDQLLEENKPEKVAYVKQSLLQFVNSHLG